MAGFCLCCVHFLTGFAAGTIWQTLSFGCHGNLSRGRLGGDFYRYILGGLCTRWACRIVKDGGFVVFAAKSERKVGWTMLDCRMTHPIGKGGRIGHSQLLEEGVRLCELA